MFRAVWTQQATAAWILLFLLVQQADAQLVRVQLLRCLAAQAPSSLMLTADGALAAGTTWHKAC
jgi:hypothetical protein